MSAPYNPGTIGNRLIELAAAKGAHLTPMQVIKLAYIAHGWSLALLDRPLLKGRVEAWRYGPVIPDLYRRLNMYGRGPIQGQIKNTIFERGEEIDEQSDRLLTQVYEKYGSLTGIQLSNLTHQLGSPWAETYKPDENEAIPDEVIKRHYAGLRKVA